MSSKPRAMLAAVQRYRHFYYFTAPFFILFAIFGLYPVLFSFYLSFTRWDGLTQRTWVGFANFQMLLDDEVFLASLWNTLVIGLLYVPLMLALAFVFAVLLNDPILRFRSFFRASFFLPCVTPMVVIAIVFGLFFSSEKGLLNYLIGLIGRALPFLHLQSVEWLQSEQWSKVSVAILVIWRWTGYNMVLMLAGLQGIPQEYYEAARVDGASAWQRLVALTLPLMRPTILFCTILSLIGTVYMFDEVFVLTRGGPGTSSTNFGLYLFNTSFVNFKFGYASCMAYVVAVCVFAASMILFRARGEAVN